MTEFNVGDVVRCTVDSYGNSFSLGTLYVVKEYPDEFGYLCVVEDDLGSKENGLHPKFFELVRRKGEFKVGDIVSWKDVPYWQNAIVRKVDGINVYADPEGKDTKTGEGLFYQNQEAYELTLVKPVEENITPFIVSQDGRLVMSANELCIGDIKIYQTAPKNHELTVNEARAIADELDDSIVNVIAVYDELIKQGFKITKD